jgi:hypothetical protein
MVLDAASTPSVSTASSSIGSSDDEDDDGSEPEETSGSTSGGNDDTTNQSSFGKEMKAGRRLHTAQLLKMVLQDAQTRLFFKAQAVIQSEVRHYVPTPDDLKWPDILLCSYSPS